MKFRPCIDIHNGQVRQIVGGSLSDHNNTTEINFSAGLDAGYYASLYADNGLSGGHVISLNPKGSEYYDENLRQMKLALSTFPKGMQAGGGINPSNAQMFLDAGASHVIVTSYVFNNGQIDDAALDRMVKEAGKENLVLDLSCRERDGRFYIVTDRWQKFTDVELTEEILLQLSRDCDEFLVHAADVEGLCRGIQRDVVKVLSNSPLKVTYAGGISTFEDLEIIKNIGSDKVDFTVGSALDLFGGKLEFKKIVEYCR